MLRSTAQWGDVPGRAGDEECELFGGMPLGDDQDLTADPLQAAEQQDELGNAGMLPFQIPQHQHQFHSGSIQNGSGGRRHPSTRRTASRQYTSREYSTAADRRSRDLQAVLHSHLQGYPNPTDIQIHGLHWTDLGKLYRS